MNIEAFHSQRAKNIYEISNWFVQWFLKTTQSCHQKKKKSTKRSLESSTSKGWNLVLTPNFSSLFLLFSLLTCSERDMAYYLSEETGNKSFHYVVLSSLNISSKSASIRWLLSVCNSR